MFIVLLQCVRSYVEFEINQGAYSISCPDAQCEKQGIILLEEIESLVSLEYVEKHKRYRLNKGKIIINFMRVKIVLHSNRVNCKSS